MESLGKLNSHTEWGKLKEVILGIPHYARVPVIKNHDIHCVDYANYESVDDLPGGHYFKEIIEQTAEELNSFSKILTTLGVKVLRPTPKFTHKLHGTPSWKSDSYYNYCPRDSALVVGNMLIETPMPLRARYFETFSMRSIYKEYFKNGCQWISAPKPELEDVLYDRSDLSKPTLTEFEPAFDAANIMRCGKDLFYLKSNSGNLLGAKWLQSVLGDKYRVHVIDNVYAYVHLDTSIVPLKPGVVLLNPTRVNDNNCPEYFKKWKKIYCPEPVATVAETDWAAGSPWIGMNVLSIDENTVVVDSRQTNLIKELESNGFDCVEILLTHSRTLSGGPHCVTLDTVREDEYNDYS